MKKYFMAQTLKGISSLYIWYFILLFFLLRLPSLIEPMWYADEGIYAVVANAMHDGRMLYAEIWDNKPPLLYILYFLTQNLFGIKLLSALFGIGGVYVFYAIAKLVFKREITVICSTLFFVFLIGTPFIEGNIANAENFMLFPMLAGFYILLKKKELTARTGIISAALFFTALLLKFVAIFDIVVWLFFVIFRQLKLKGKIYDKHFRQGIISFFLTSFFLGFVTVGVLMSLGIFQDFYDAVFFKNISYVSEKNTAWLSNSLLIIKSILLLGFVLTVFKLRKKIKTENMFIFLWLGFSLFNVFFSQRYFGHYLLLLAPSLALLLGLAIDYKGKKRVIYSGVFVLVLTIVGFSFEFFERIPGYYKNYFQFVFSGKSIDSYQSFFDSTTPRNYEIARILKNTKNKNVLVWSDGGQIYTLLGQAPPGKYIVAYHVLFYKDALLETKTLLEKKKPDVIVEVTQVPRELDLLDDYQELLRVDGVKIYERQ